MSSIYRVDILEDKLRELTESLPGIKGTVIVSFEGFVVASYAAPDESDGRASKASTPQVAAMAATLVALGEQALSRLSQGEVERLLVEGQGGAIIVYPINRDAALAAMVDKKAKLGLTLLAVSRAAAFFGSVLRGPT
ncbi:MAG: roadblock/LC7 domain-containing protein [Candidatus Promineifilaceae bacterium]